MKGITIEKNGGADVLQYHFDLSVPKPGNGQVLVHNKYSGLNFIDIYYRSGLYRPPHFPYVLGRESAGTIVALGDGEVFGLKLGDTVACLSEGTYAEYTAAPAIRTVKLPTSISTSIAAASFQQGLTALTLIREAYHVKRNDWVLVHAAAGGTGQWLVRLLRIVGAHTIGTASTAEKIEVARQAGATHTIQYTKEDVKSRVMELTGNKGVSVVFDGVGKSTFDLSLDVIARKGSLICFGNASGSPEPLVLARLSPKNLRLMRPMLLGFVQMREEFIRYTEELFGLMERHESNIPYEVYPLSGASQAQRDLERRGTTGKLILSTST